MNRDDIPSKRRMVSEAGRESRNAVRGQNSKAKPLRTCVNGGAFRGIREELVHTQLPVQRSLDDQGLMRFNGQSDGGMSWRGESPQSLRTWLRSAPSTLLSKLMSAAAL